ncbi:conserved hypothetical protein [Gloeothece citriformis PCC 7424]|uniref:Calcium-binding protein n=1 Tax=Gloeothece citriformis (strain PCC 7424) TaxID=65393 RepID=B7K714_GLOC7|nr:hypothetical protein [Gloeothece citriformis]ACK72713.1 conserved hypothetical protein [Gloeothece citriformis PCC 7424]
MRILFTIPHFYKPSSNPRYGSQRKDPTPRLQALTQCITNLHQLFGKSQWIIDIANRSANPLSQAESCDIDIIICTTSSYHLLEELPLPAHFYKHHSSEVEPMLLGFECQAVLRDSLGQYDYYCFLEDDLILHDPWLFIKLAWFNNLTTDLNLLQPNRYEVSAQHFVNKVYVDGPIALKATAKFQNLQDQPELKGKIMNHSVIFERCSNPHSGCYFLNSRQMELWVKQSYFLDYDNSFIGYLESAATLGIMRTFRIYKPAPTNANFLEIQHFGTAFLGLIGNQISISSSEKMSEKDKM